MEISWQVLLWGFGIAVVMGAVVNKTNFCTMGAVSDWVNMGDTGRLRSWLLAIAVALAGILLLEATGVIVIDSSLPPYRTASFAWLRYLLGGVIFGIGMTLGSGCGNKTLVRIGGGNLKSIVVFLFIGIFAYLMTKTNFYAVAFHGWLVQPTTIDLASRGIPSQELGDLVAGLFGAGNGATLHQILGWGLAIALFVIIFKSVDFRRSFDNLLGGLVVGLAVVAAWYVTGGAMGEAWKDAAMWAESPPINVASQSYTFINPMGEVLAWGGGGFNVTLVSFGMMAVAGVILGSFLYAILSRGFRWEWFQSWGDAGTHVVGGSLMGIGGVLAMGCTVGQGITGVSTLALGSFLAFGGIVFGSALTMKIQYYKMVYEGEATFTAALLSSLVDMRLLPGKLRRLEAV